MFLEQAVDDDAAGGAVEVAGRLVGQDDAHAGGEGAGDGDALLLAAGKLARIVPQPMAEADGPQLLFGPRERLRGALELERHGDVLQRGHGR